MKKRKGGEARRGVNQLRRGEEGREGREGKGESMKKTREDEGREGSDKRGHSPQLHNRQRKEKRWWGICNSVNGALQ